MVWNLAQLLVLLKGSDELLCPADPLLAGGELLLDRLNLVGMDHLLS